MKRLTIPILLLLFIVSLYLPHAHGQHYSRWDLPEGAKLRIGKGSINNIMYSPDGNQLIVQCFKGIWIYDLQTGVELDYITDQDAEVYAVSSDANMYVSLTTNGQLHIRSLVDGTIRSTLQPQTQDIRRVAISPDGSTFAATIRSEIHLWNIDTGEQIGILTGHTSTVNSLVFSPDGNTLVSGSWHDTVRVWDVASATQKRNLSQHQDSIRTVLYSPDGSKIASLSANSNVVHLWDTDTERYYQIKPTKGVSKIAFSPDGRTIAIGHGGGGLYLWDLQTQETIVEFTGHTGNNIRSIVFSPDGKSLASGGSEELFIWNTETGAVKRSITGHTDSVIGLTFSSDGKTLITGGWGQFNIWDATNAKHKDLFFTVEWGVCEALALSNDGNTLAVKNSQYVLLWDLPRRMHIATLSGYGGEKLTSSYLNASLVYSADGKYLIGTNEFYSAIHVWYMGRTHVKAFIGHTAGVTSMALSNHDRFLVSGSNDNTVRLWDFATGSNLETYTGHTDRVFTVALNDDKSIIASGGRDNTIKLWDITTGESRTIPAAHNEEVRKIAFSPDGKTLVSCGGWEDATVKIWDVASAQLIRTLTGHAYAVLNLTFSPDENTLATGSYDGTVLLWDYNSIIDTDGEILQTAEDVNRDGVVDLQDLIYVASQFGQPADENPADVNDDGTINITDLILVAAALQDVNAAPVKYTQAIQAITTSDVQQWLTQVHQVNTHPATVQKGIVILEQLLSLLTPEKTALLPNYPNPFNPETWIPYQLNQAAKVTIQIYSPDGNMVRTLDLGNQSAGIYQTRSKAAYWDGKNEAGEPVASGIYFYTLSAGNYSATRRMVIRK